MNNTTFRSAGPAAIGGGGGSGTRVVAHMLQHLGFHIGKDLNPEKDNLWFTLLFKRPRWFLQSLKKGGDEIMQGLSIFERAMNSCLDPGRKEIYFILKAAVEMAVKGHDHLHTDRGLRPFFLALSLMRSQNTQAADSVGWGWKEPNTHIYLEYLNRHFPALKYIHVIRHGLDMAYSANQTQLFNWGTLLGVKPPSSKTSLPKASLQYWIASNQRAIILGKELLDGRFFVLNFDNLCDDPVSEITALTGFLGIDAPLDMIETLKGLVNKPASSGRYQREDLSCFSAEEIDAVMALGFEVQQ